MGCWSFDHANWQAVSTEAKAILGSMLQVNPARRATAAVVLRSAWLLRHGRVRALDVHRSPAGRRRERPPG